MKVVFPSTIPTFYESELLFRDEDGEAPRHTFILQPNSKSEAYPTGVPISATASYCSWRPSQQRRSDMESPASRSRPHSRVQLRLVLLLCIGWMLSRLLDPGRVEEEAPRLPVPLGARKNQWVCTCCVNAAPVPVVSAVDEVLFGVEG